MRLPVTAFDYVLPPDRIAQRPRPYAEQRLLVHRRATDITEHRRFAELPALLRAGDLLIVNNSRVVPAQLGAHAASAVLILEPTAGRFTGLRTLCPARTRVGDRLSVPGGHYLVTAVEPGSPVCIGDLQPNDPACPDLVTFLDTFGTTPLPPYVRRPPDADDQRDYQTVFASAAGSIAAPTAGLHFHPALLAALDTAGIEVAAITLHVGYGTFRPFHGTYVDEHVMDAEWYEVTGAVARTLWQARRQRRRVIAVGTTAARTLETIAPTLDDAPPPDGLAGAARLFIAPPYHFRMLGGLITNFHYPRTPVMSLTAAWCGSVERLLELYRTALERDYLFYSYGDAMLVL